MKAKVGKGSSISPKMQKPMNLKTVFSSFPQGIVVADEKGSIIECNQAMLDLSGYVLKDEIIGKNVREFVSVKDKQRVMEKLKKSVEQGSVANIVCAFLTKDGCEFPAELTASLMKGPSGSSSGFVVAIEDITERKKKEDALQENEERFKQVAENAQEWIWEVDAQGVYTYASPAVEKILGYKPKEIVGKKHFYDLFPLEDREELKKAAFETFTQKQEFQGFVNKNVHKKGNLVWLSTSGIPILDEKGTLLGYRGTDMEITERKKAEEALSSAEQKFRNIFEQAKDAFIYLDKFGNILDVNAKTIEIFGGKKEELLGKNFTKVGVLSIKKIPMLMKAFMNALAGKEVNIELQIKSKKNKLIDLECSATPLKINGTTGIMVTAKDITERKKTEEALRESEEKYRNLVENSQDAITIIDFKGNVLFGNNAAENLTGIAWEKELA